MIRPVDDVRLAAVAVVAIVAGEAPVVVHADLGGMGRAAVPGFS